jgi:hypothetical protein
MITQKAIHDENNIINFPHLNVVADITRSIYTNLEEFYKQKKIYLWTSFAWLSSAYIFTQNLNSDDLNEIRKQTVTLGLENIPITMLYDQILPWNANLKTLIDFKTIVENVFTQKLCQYVKSQAEYIYIYFVFTDVNDVNDGVFTRLQKSTKWYKSGTQELFKLMESTIEGFKIPDEINSVIVAIEKISIHTIDEFKDCMDYMKEDHEKKSRLNDILSSINSDYVIQLNKDFLKNCVDAIHFINEYIVFLNNTDGLPDLLETYDVQELCKNGNLDSVFITN